MNDTKMPALTRARAAGGYSWGRREAGNKSEAGRSIPLEDAGSIINQFLEQPVMMRVILILLFPFLEAIGQQAQPDMAVFAERRAAFMKQLDPSGVVILPSKPECNRNGDVEYEYRQESNFYYLTGYEEPESILLLNPSAPKNRYVLFVRDRSRLMETFQGPRSGVEGAMSIFKADTALLISDLATSISALVPEGGTLYYPFGINLRIDERIRSTFLDAPGTPWSIRDPLPILAEMRVIKHDSDWRMGFQKAIDISVDAQIDAIKAVRPRMYEYEVQAVFEYDYRRNGSPRNGYPCIIGSGPNSCILHHDNNDRRMEDGDLVLMDCGAEYGYYTADITRTVPVNGKFTREQRDVYQLVLDAQKAAIPHVKPGCPWNVPDSVMKDILAGGLLRLGFIKQKSDASVFTLHPFSHWLGMDVHDVGKTLVGGRPRPLVAGMVFTLEPGIYIRPDVFDKLKDMKYTPGEIARLRVRLAPYMNIGVRIEDDILVTEEGCRNLTEGAPRDMETIEGLMRH